MNNLVYLTAETRIERNHELVQLIRDIEKMTTAKSNKIKEMSENIAKKTRRVKELTEILFVGNEIITETLFDSQESENKEKNND